MRGKSNTNNTNWIIWLNSALLPSEIVVLGADALDTNIHNSKAAIVVPENVAKAESPVLSALFTFHVGIYVLIQGKITSFQILKRRANTTCSQRMPATRG